MERSTHAIKNGVYHLFRLGPSKNHGERLVITRLGNPMVIPSIPLRWTTPPLPTLSSVSSARVCTSKADQKWSWREMVADAWNVGRCVKGVHDHGECSWDTFYRKYVYIYIYIYVCVFVCVCTSKNMFYLYVCVYTLICLCISWWICGLNMAFVNRKNDDQPWELLMVNINTDNHFAVILHHWSWGIFVGYSLCLCSSHHGGGVQLPKVFRQNIAEWLSLGTLESL